MGHLTLAAKHLSLEGERWGWASGGGGSGGGGPDAVPHPLCSRKRSRGSQEDEFDGCAINIISSIGSCIFTIFPGYAVNSDVQRNICKIYF